MPNIKVSKGLPGHRGIMAFRPEVARSLNHQVNFLVLILTFIFFPLSSFSNPITVEKIKGNRAIVIFDPTSNALKIGETLNSDSDLLGDDPDEEDIAAASKTLKKKYRRLHGLSLSLQYTTGELTSGSSKTSSNSTEIDGDYNYNLGKYEITVGLTLITTDDDGSRSTQTFLSPGAQYNFVKNKSGNDLIPFVGVGLYTGTIELNTGSSKNSATRSGYFVKGGIKYFPFSDSFAVTAAIGIYDITDKYSNSAGTETKQKYTSLITGWSVYF